MAGIRLSPRFRKELARYRRVFAKCESVCPRRRSPRRRTRAPHAESDELSVTC